MSDRLEDARAQRAADIEALNELDDDQVAYLERVDLLHDRVTDGIGCEADT